ncbi:MAG: calcium-binding protein, partial [Pseudomonadota bacterium]
MAQEFITGVETSTYNIDSGDLIFMTETGSIQTGIAFAIGNPVPAEFDLFIAGDIYAQRLTNFSVNDDLDYNIAISHTSTIFASADVFVFIGFINKDTDLSITNEGSVTTGEVFLFARNYDNVDFHNSGTINAIGSQVDEAVFDTIASPSTVWNISNSGLIQSTADQKIMELSGFITFENTGTVLASIGDAFDFEEGAFTLINSGDIGADIRAEDDFIFANSGEYRGDIVATGDSNLINAGLLIGSVTFGGRPDAIANEGTIIGVVQFGNGNNTLSNSGLINMANDTVDFGTGIDTVINTGTIIGSIDLNISGDTYRASGDGLVTDTVFGGSGNDVLIGGDKGDAFDGGNDDDVLSGRGGDDTLLGGLGNDTLVGGSGADNLQGVSGNNVLNGQDGNDAIVGGTGDDRLFGGNGDDTLSAGGGADILRGDAGADVFAFDSVTDTGTGSTRDRILGWEDGADLIDLSGFGALEFSASGPVGSGTASVWFQSVSGGAQTML